MASLSSISIELNVTGEREATQALRRFKDQQEQTSKSILTAANQIERSISELEKLERLKRRGIINSRQQAEAEKAVARELAALNNLYTRNGRLNTQAAQAQIRSARAAQENAKAAEEAARAQARYARETENLRRTFNVQYAQFARARDAIRQLTEAKRRGILSSEQYAQRIADIRQSYDRMQLGGAGARRSSNDFGVAVQQAGFQISDFAIQVQSGQNVLVAFSQQASQLVGVLPLVANQFGLTTSRAIALSAGLGIAIPLITVAAQLFLNLGKEADDAEEKLEGFEGRVKSLDSTLQAYAQTQDALSRGLLPEEALGLDALDRAKRDLREATDALENFRRLQEGALRSGLGLPDFTGSRQRAEEEAVNQVIAARIRLSELENKLAQERVLLFSEEKRELQDQVRVQDLIKQFGEDSKEVAEEESRIRQETFARRVSELDLTEKQKQVLIELNSVLESNRLELDSMVTASGKLLTNLSGIVGERAIQRGVRTGSIPPQALADLNRPMVEQRATERALEEREEARREAAKANSPDRRRGGVSEEERSLDRLEKRFETLLRNTMTNAENLAAGMKELDTLLEAGRFSAEQRAAAEEALRRQYDKSYLIAQDLAELIGTDLTSAFRAAADGTKSVGDALTDFVNNVLLGTAERLFRSQISDPLTSVLEGSLTGITGPLLNANGNVFGRSGVQAFAMGGVVNQATPFMFGNGGRLGVMGEAGPEAILPLSRGANGKLGVQSSGGTEIVINNYTGQEATATQGGNGRIEVQIGRAVAADITGGGPTYRAIKQTFGLGQQVVRR